MLFVEGFFEYLQFGYVLCNQIELINHNQSLIKTFFNYKMDENNTIISYCINYFLVSFSIVNQMTFLNIYFLFKILKSIF